MSKVATTFAQLPTQFLFKARTIFGDFALNVRQIVRPDDCLVACSKRNEIWEMGKDASKRCNSRVAVMVLHLLVSYPKN